MDDNVSSVLADGIGPVILMSFVSDDLILANTGWQNFGHHLTANHLPVMTQYTDWQNLDRQLTLALAKR